MFLFVLGKKFVYQSLGLHHYNFYRSRYLWKIMDCQILHPPEAVCGMRELRREEFEKSVKVPCLRVREEYTNRVLRILKDNLLKMQHLKPVREFVPKSETQTEENSANYKEILLHPACVTGWESLPNDKLKEYNIERCNFYHNDLKLSYDNWRADEILEFVLSNEIEGLTSYSRIGHIIHLNLREHLMPYKELIAQVFADKLNGIRTVVNKAANIDNTYRNFEFELLYGEPDYKVETKENGIAFEFDFSRVYWNPRLSTEHQRIVDLLQPNDVLYDVFAGVGPFSVPAAKKRCYVLANDLNPESFRWLRHNMKRNKCMEYAKLFNKDGRDFIFEDLKQDLLNRWRAFGKDAATDSNYNIHITMNLPALAVEFLDTFCGLFKKEELASLKICENNLPLVHVYTFAKGADTKKLAITLVETNLGVSLGESLQSISFVRNVAPNKDMYRISFRLSNDLLTTPKKENSSEHCLKRTAIDAIGDEINVKNKIMHVEDKL